MSKVDDKVDVFVTATEAAKAAGSPYPEAVAEFILDKLAVVDALPGPTVMMRNGMECESLDMAMAKLKQSADIGPLFTDGKLDVRTMSLDAFQAVRRHYPELLGLRKKRKFA